MRCEEVSDLIEPWAAGELTPPAEAVTHMNGCPRCAVQLALARQLDRLLARRQDLSAPPQFSQDVLRRARRDWWRAEERLDRWFNAALVAGLLLVAAGIWLLFDLSGLVTVTSDVSMLIGTAASALVRQIDQSLPVYAGVTALLMTVLLVWQWTDGDLSL